MGAISPTHDYVKRGYFEKGEDGKYRLTEKAKQNYYEYRNSTGTRLY